MGTTIVFAISLFGGLALLGAGIFFQVNFGAFTCNQELCNVLTRLDLFELCCDDPPLNCLFGLSSCQCNANPNGPECSCFAHVTCTEVELNQQLAIGFLVTGSFLIVLSIIIYLCAGTSRGK